MSLILSRYVVRYKGNLQSFLNALQNLVDVALVLLDQAKVLLVVSVAEFKEL